MTLVFELRTIGISMRKNVVLTTIAMYSGGDRGQSTEEKVVLLSLCGKHCSVLYVCPLSWLKADFLKDIKDCALQFPPVTFWQSHELKL